MPDKEIMLQIRAREGGRCWVAFEALMNAEAARVERGGTAADAGEPLRNALAALAEDWRATADLYQAAKLKGASSAYVLPLRHAAAELDKVIKALEQPRRAPLGQLQTPAQPESAGLDEPVHRFKPGASGRVCAALVERLIGQTPCGRFASHPAHRMQTPAANPAGLDALIADSVAKARGEVPIPTLRDGDVPVFTMTGRPELPATPEMPEGGADSVAKLRPIAEREGGSTTAELDAEGVPDLRGPGDLAAPLGDAAAYLRGETATLEGGHPLQPGSVRDQTPPEAIGLDGALALFGLAEAGERAQRAIDDPSSLVPGYRSEPLSDPARNTARQILETMPVSATIPPVPLLGQPGDAGAGYDHAYIPPGGVPMTYAELLTPVPAAALPAHLSHSQIGTVGECGVKYRAQRIGRNDGHDLGDPLTEIPQWANIGGSAFHAAVESWERWAAIPGNEGAALDTIAPPATAMWTEYFDKTIAEIESTSPVPRSRWRSANRGVENEGWWRAQGPLMLQRYLDARPAEPTATLNMQSAIEFEHIVDVPTPYGPLPYKAILDRVTVRYAGPQGPGAEVTLVIRDYKTSRNTPESTQQLGEYASVLRLLGVPAHVRIVGTYFMARTGKWTPEADLSEWTPEWFSYHVASGHAQRLALTTGPTPARPTSFCGGCPVRWACPVKTPRPASP